MRFNNSLLKKRPCKLLHSSITSAKKLAYLFKGVKTGKKKLDSRITLKFIAPGDFPQHLIMIGDIVYIIASYGLPIWDGKMFQPLKEKDVAYLITFRRKDTNLANAIDNHLKTLIASQP